MKLQAVMENLHRQQRAKLLMEQVGHSHGPAPTGEELKVNSASDTEQAQMAALAAMRAVAAGLQRAESPMSERSSGGEEDDEEEGEEQYNNMMGSEEEEQIKQKWDEDDFEDEMEEDYDDDDLGDEVLPSGREAVTPGRGILLLPHRHLHPHSQLLKTQPGSETVPRVSALSAHSSHGPLPGQDHADWTYEEQFRQLYELDIDPKRKEFLDDLFSFMQKRGTPVNRIPIMAKQVLDLYMLYQLVTEKGGLVEVINKKLWREITKGLNLPTSITSAAFTLRTQYMKYLYPYECDKRGLSNPNELQAAIDSNRREGRRQGFGSSLFTYSPNGTPTMLSSPKLSMPPIGITLPSNGTPLSSLQKAKKDDDGVQARLPVSLASHSVAAAAQAATIAQVAALEQLRDKLESGEPPEKKIALPMEEHQRLLQRALQHNLLAMTAQIPMNIRINNQESRPDSALNLTTNGLNSISMSLELNGVVYTGVLFAQAAAPTSSGVSNKSSTGNNGPQSVLHTPTSSSSNNQSP
ncbi:AT-rich interactive domain-containing protein 3A-like [Xyrauchen texanus]|uniref:AT-rich interactive domain-containing protein 3A-like n=1 Tax=Xyrauchen texanus TaxID=154827 RepID=UPI0022429282|nr:AT-rich interactive domain-containing protein 3A-like [Xyrauchen texanus]XP_051967849.1 AT-rich interactive domain-containing protein 3A-like [Xyrauchen texanus]